MKLSMSFFFCLIIAIGSTAITGNRYQLRGFSWDMCQPDEPAYIEYMDIKPDPILIPGTVTLSLSLDILQDIVAPTEGNIDLKYRINSNFDWVDIPCFDEEVFSCHYDDFCAFMDDAFPPDAPCPESFGDFPCRCPYPAGHYELNDATFEFPNHSLLIQGDYHLRVELTGATCYDVYFTLRNAQ